MGVLRRLADRFDPPETRVVDAAALGLDLATGRLINAAAAENLSTVLACVAAIASAIASLPAFVFRRATAGRTIAEGHPLMRLVREGPNPHQSWPNWCEWTMASVLLRGNALSQVVVDGAGRIEALVPIPWDCVSVQRLPSGRLAFDVVAFTGPFGATGRPRRLLEGEVLHLKDRSDDGLVGKSRLQRAAAVLSAGLSLQDFANALWENGAFPSGALELDGHLGEEAYNQLKTNFRDSFSGTKNAAKAMILDQGVKWKSIAIAPEDAEVLASRRFSTEELARVFNVPPPIIGDLSHGTFTNAETAGRWFAQHTLAPWIRKFEAEVSRSVFAAGERATHALELDLSGFLRGDPETRWRSHQIAIATGVLSPNEVREVEGFNPRPGGDTFTAATPAAGP